MDRHLYHGWNDNGNGRIHVLVLEAFFFVVVVIGISAMGVANLMLGIVMLVLDMSIFTNICGHVCFVNIGVIHDDILILIFIYIKASR